MIDFWINKSFLGHSLPNPKKKSTEKKRKSSRFSAKQEINEVQKKFPAL